MLILYVAMKYDYGRREQGYSFEHYNFYDSLRRMGHDILYFDFMTLVQERGKRWTARRLWEVVKADRPQLMFTVLFGDELERSVVRRISHESQTATVNWFCDDHWRFEELSKRWAPCFNWVVTTANSALPKYRRLGFQNVIKSQWACNTFLYRRLNVPKRYDVTFLGQQYGDRASTIAALREAGLDVRTWGQGWKEGRLSQERLIEVFNESRINLNLANASSVERPRQRPMVEAARRLVSRAIGRVPEGTLKRAARSFLARAHGAHPSGAVSRPTPAKAPPSQIKARNFEVPGCGGFLLTEPTEGLEDHYRVGREIAVFDGVSDLVDKARYYLQNEEERASIADAAYQRTLLEHTYVHRFREIFRRMGLPDESATVAAAEHTPAGSIVEIT